VEENKGSGYVISTTYESKEKEIKIECTSISQNDLKLGERNLAEENIKKTTEIYKHKKKGEFHGH
jgi:16S rRNA G1207 methylase RsmC